jgi:large subunit ribosomal protein L25
MELKVQNRNIFGAKVKTLRQQGLIPAELYGHGIKNLHLSLPAKEFKKVLKEAGESTVVNLLTEDNKTLPAMIHEFKTDSLSGEILNVDFYQIKLDEKIRVHIPIEFIGEAAAIKNFGGILVKTIKTIEVEALPNDLPHKFEADLSKLDEIGKSISAKDLKTGDKVKIFISPETVIATVVEAKKEAEEVPPPTAPTAETTPTEAAPETPASSTKKETPKT